MCSPFPFDEWPVGKPAIRKYCFIRGMLSECQAGRFLVQVRKINWLFAVVRRDSKIGVPEA